MFPMSSRFADENLEDIGYKGEKLALIESWTYLIKKTANFEIANVSSYMSMNQFIRLYSTITRLDTIKLGILFARRLI